MERFFTTILLTIILTALGSVFSQSVLAQSNDAKQQLIERFRANSKTDHKAAYEAAKEFFQKYPEDTSDDAQHMKRWMTAYEKLELNGQPSSSSDNQPTSNSGNSSPPAGAETPEVSEARVAITKYKDYASAIKSLESSAESTKKTAIWLQYMAIAQEGVGNEAEELKYLEKYNELVPNQRETVEKLADLRYRVKKKLAADNEKAEKEGNEVAAESRFGTLEQTLAWLKANATTSMNQQFYYTNRSIDFSGKKLIWINCSVEQFKHEQCSTSTVLLNNLDLQSLRLSPDADGEVSVIVNTKNEEELITCAVTYKGKPTHDCAYRWQLNFSYDTEDKAKIVFLALRHAIRLSQ